MPGTLLPSILKELKLMAMGLLSGIRALSWAIVLLMAPCLELIGFTVPATLRGIYCEDYH